MVARYESTRKALIDKTYGINDTKSIWFDIASIKKFIDGLPAETTGVRIHLAAYDDTNAEAPGQTTVVLIGTLADDSDAVTTGKVPAAGFEPENSGKACPPICVPPDASLAV